MNTYFQPFQWQGIAAQDHANSNYDDLSWMFDDLEPPEIQRINNQTAINDKLVWNFYINYFRFNFDS